MVRGSRANGAVMFGQLFESLRSVGLDYARTGSSVDRSKDRVWQATTGHCLRTSIQLASANWLQHVS